jgi:hypothetical protein
MAIKVPRAQRQVQDPSGALRTQAVAQTGPGQALEALGAGLQDLSIGVRKLGQARERMNLQELVNRATDASTLVQRDMQPIRAQELQTPGLDSIGNRDRFNEEIEKSINLRTQDMSDEGKTLVRRNLSNFLIGTEKELAIHEASERRKVTASNLEQVKSLAMQNVANNPLSLESEIKQVANTVNQFRAIGAIGEEEAQNTLDEYMTDIRVSAIEGEMLRNADQAQQLLDTLREGIPADAQKTLQSDIKKQSKLQKEKTEANRVATVEAFQNNLTTQIVDGDVPTETAIRLSPAWDIMNSEEKAQTLSIQKKGDPFFVSDPLTLADFTTRVNTAPQTLTDQDFIDALGRKENGLSTKDFQSLITKWKSDKDRPETPQESAQKTAYKVLNDARTKKIFSDDKLQNELAWATSTQALDSFIKENPNAKPEDYTNFVENTLTLPEKDFINRTFDFFRDDDKDIRFRAEAIKALTEAKFPVTEANILSVMEQLEEQRAE